MPNANGQVLYTDLGHHANYHVHLDEWHEICANLSTRIDGIMVSITDTLGPQPLSGRSGVGGNPQPISDWSGSKFDLNATYHNHIRDQVRIAGSYGLDVMLQCISDQPTWVSVSGDSGILRAENAYNAGVNLGNFYGNETNIKYWLHGWDFGEGARGHVDTIYGNLVSGMKSTGAVSVNNPHGYMTQSNDGRYSSSSWYDFYGAEPGHGSNGGNPGNSLDQGWWNGAYNNINGKDLFVIEMNYAHLNEDGASWPYPVTSVAQMAEHINQTMIAGDARPGRLLGVVYGDWYRVVYCDPADGLKNNSAVADGWWNGVKTTLYSATDPNSHYGGSHNYLGNDGETAYINRMGISVDDPVEPHWGTASGVYDELHLAFLEYTIAELDEHFAYLAANGFEGTTIAATTCDDASGNPTSAQPQNRNGQGGRWPITSHTPTQFGIDDNWFNFVRNVVLKAKEHGLKCAIIATGNQSKWINDTNTGVLRTTNAYDLGRLMAEKLGDLPNVPFWVMGWDEDRHKTDGSCHGGNRQEGQIFANLIQGIKDHAVYGNDYEFTAHCGKGIYDAGSSFGFSETAGRHATESWLDFHYVQSGHVSGESSDPSWWTACANYLTSIGSNKPIWGGEVNYANLGDDGNTWWVGPRPSIQEKRNDAIAMRDGLGDRFKGANYGDWFRIIWCSDNPPFTLHPFNSISTGNFDPGVKSTYEPGPNNNNLNNVGNSGEQLFIAELDGGTPPTQHTVELRYSTNSDLSNSAPLNGASLIENTDYYVFATVTPNSDVTNVDMHLDNVFHRSDTSDPYTYDAYDAGAQVNEIPKTNWTLMYVDSEETQGEDGRATNAFDGDTQTFWHTEWFNSTPTHPHEIQIDLGATYPIEGFVYGPRISGGQPANGRIAGYEFYVGSGVEIPPTEEPPGNTIDGDSGVITGGAGGSVYTVTNLNNSGAGSFREAISGDNRIVEFAVSGNIDLSSYLAFSGSNITVRGETAPAPGICLRANDDTVMFFTGSNIIVQWLRVRGQAAGQSNGGNGHCAVFDNATNIALSHLSLSWANDEIMTFQSQNDRIVVQWCMLYECFYPHSMGILMTDLSAVPNDGYHTNIMFHHNLLTNLSERWPRLNSEEPCTIDWRNNLTYNVLRHGNLDNPLSGTTKVNYVNNKEIRGPNWLSGRTDSQDLESGIEVYSVGNVAPSGVSWLAGGNSVVSPTWSVPSVGTDTVGDMEMLVKQHAGASYLLGGLGWTPSRDSADARIVTEVDTDTGPGQPPGNVAEAGGFPF